MLTGIIAVAIGLGIMVLVHEWGHFVIARLFGVRVEVFSIGFGPRLFGVKRGPTDYRLSALPLGGYVRMAGDNPAEERRGDPDEFLSKPRWQRVLIALAGPTTNFLMAVVLTAGLLMTAGQQLSYADKTMIVGGVLPDSPAEKAGIQPGDRIASFNGARNPTWDRALWELGLSAGTRSISVVVERGGQLIPLNVPVEAQIAAGPICSTPVCAIVGYPSEPVVIESVAPHLPAENAGLQSGDAIVVADARPLVSPSELSEIIRKSNGQPIHLDIVRNGQPKTIEVRPKWGDPGDGTARWEIGVTFHFARSPERLAGPLALLKATQFHVLLSHKLIYLVGDLFTGKVSLKQVQGPVGIVQETSRAAKYGLGAVINLMALISLNLAILNLLPIPILDGGHILMLGIEGLLRHDLSLKIKERFVTAGMVFLLLIFLMVMYNDLSRILLGH